MKRLAFAALALVALTGGSGLAWEPPDLSLSSQKDGAAVCGDAVRLARLARIDESPDLAMIELAWSARSSG